MMNTTAAAVATAIPAPGWEASPQELEVLWDAVVESDHLQQASDGRRRWSFLVDFQHHWVSSDFPDFAGAIVHAEDGYGPIAAWLYSTPAALARAWDALSTSPHEETP